MPGVDVAILSVLSVHAGAFELLMRDVEKMKRLFVEDSDGSEAEDDYEIMEFTNLISAEVNGTSDAGRQWVTSPRSISRFSRICETGFGMEFCAPVAGTWAIDLPMCLCLRRLKTRSRSSRRW